MGIWVFAVNELVEYPSKELQVQQDSSNFMRRLPDRTPEVVQFNEAGTELYRERDNRECFCLVLGEVQNCNILDKLNIPLDALDKPSMISLRCNIHLIAGKG
jgi:hypothetical protein